MLSSLVPPLLPSSVTRLFDPPLDASHLNLSLLRGRLELSNLTLHAAHINRDVLSPLFPVHLLRGRVGALVVELNWSALWSEPLRVQARDVELVVGHNQSEGTPTPTVATAASASAGLSEAEQKQSVAARTAELEAQRAAAIAEHKAAFGLEAASGRGASTADPLKIRSTFHPSSTEAAAQQQQAKQHAAAGRFHFGAPPPELGGVGEEELLRLAVEAKKLALEAAHPSALNFSPPSGPDVSALQLSGVTRKLVSMLLRALCVELTGLRVSYVHSACAFEAAAAAQVAASAPRGESQSSPIAPTSVDDAIRGLKEAGVEEQKLSHAVITLDLPKLTLDNLDDEDAKKLPENVRDVMKQLRMQGLSMWCDVPGHAPMTGGGVTAPLKQAAPMPGVSESGAAASSTSSKEERGVTAPSTSTSTTARASHEYILPPLDPSFTFAVSDDFNLKTELLLHSVWPAMLLHVRPEQLQCLLAVYASLARHAAATQRTLEAVAARHFRAATADERDRYIQLYKYQSAGHTLRAGNAKLMKRIERDVMFADVCVMRGVAFMELAVAAARKRQQQLVEAGQEQPQPEPLQHEAEQAEQAERELQASKKAAGLAPVEEGESDFFTWLAQSMGFGPSESTPQQTVTAESRVSSAKEAAPMPMGEVGQRQAAPVARGVAPSDPPHAMASASAPGSASSIRLTAKSDAPLPPHPLEHAAAKATEHKAMGARAAAQQHEAKIAKMD